MRSSLIDRLRLWSQDLYLACLADSGLPASQAQVGALQLRATVRRYTKFGEDPLAPPSLRNHATRDGGDLVVRDSDYRKARERFCQRLSRSLLLDLDILQNDVLLKMINEKGLNAAGGVESYINQLDKKLKDDLPWAYFRSIELSAVRNCITHNRQVWQIEQINRLSNINNSFYPAPCVGDQINIKLAYLFAYKTAVRHVLSRCMQKAFP